MKRIHAYFLIVALLILGSSSAFTCAQNLNRNGNGKVSTSASSPLKVNRPTKEGSVRFVIIGDTGTGSRQQRELADILIKARETFPYDFVLLLGDNLYGSAFYCLNSNYMDKKQLDWLENELAKDKSEWKITFHHHPPYSSGGKHGSDSALRKVVEPIFVKYGVNAVFTGHDHFYERIRPQKGIYYFVSGAGGKLRSGDVKDNSPLTDKFFDRDMSFMLVEVVDNQLHFQVISR
ncbi:MAG: metallophosphoesterase, partial [Pyrinomonadaceae bacterium]|nr:metallophosphoesterase [Pyrinomonadaceae bacterium]